MGVKFQHPDYKRFAPKWTRVRDVVAGQDAVHSKGEVYLPKLAEQSNKEYLAYVKRATFYNASWRTFAGLLGMLFRKAPATELPPAVDDYLKDVTMSGVSMDTFAEQVANERLEVSRLGILVDRPPMPEGARPSVADAEKMGLRPTLQLYKAETIINWKFRTVRNQTMLSMVVLVECQTEPKDEFEDKVTEVYRVLDLDDRDLYRVRVFKASDTGIDEQIGSDVYPLMNGQPMTEIPFILFDKVLDDPALIDLVDLNLAHYRVTADYEHGCHFTGLPTAVISGYQDPDPKKPMKFYIGSTSAWVFPSSEAKATFLEFTGQGLGALEKNLDRKEQQMAVLGARMLAAEKKQAETATTSAIHRTGENSILSAISIDVSQGLTKALEIFCAWADQPDAEIKYELNRDFLPVTMDAATLTALMAAWQGGGLSEPEFFDLLKRGDLVEPDKTLEEHQGEIDAAPPPTPPGALPSDPVPGKPKPKDQVKTPANA